jgi:hypothetical protein
MARAVQDEDPRVGTWDPSEGRQEIRDSDKEALDAPLTMEELQGCILTGKIGKAAD